MILAAMWLAVLIVIGGQLVGMISMTGWISFWHMPKDRVQAIGASMVEMMGLAGLAVFLLGLNAAMGGFI